MTPEDVLKNTAVSMPDTDLSPAEQLESEVRSRLSQQIDVYESIDVFQVEGVWKAAIRFPNNDTAITPLQDRDSPASVCQRLKEQIP
jgi:hypothetical protein